MTTVMVKMAVTAQRDAIIEQLAGRTEGRFVVPLIGVPGGALTAQGVATRDADGIWLRITRVGDQAVAGGSEPVRLDVTWRWEQMPPGHGLQPEAIAVDDAGNDVVALVDTNVRTWRLTCQCGRVRYAKRKDARNCRVCRAEERRKYKSEWQRNRRKQASASTRRATT